MDQKVWGKLKSWEKGAVIGFLYVALLMVLTNLAEFVFSTQVTITTTFPFIPLYLHYILPLYIFSLIGISGTLPMWLTAIYYPLIFLSSTLMGAFIGYIYSSISNIRATIEDIPDYAKGGIFGALVGLILNSTLKIIPIPFSSISMDFTGYTELSIANTLITMAIFAAIFATITYLYTRRDTFSRNQQIFIVIVSLILVVTVSMGILQGWLPFAIVHENCSCIIRYTDELGNSHDGLWCGTAGDAFHVNYRCNSGYYTNCQYQTLLHSRTFCVNGRTTQCLDGDLDWAYSYACCRFAPTPAERCYHTLSGVRTDPYTPLILYSISGYDVSGLLKASHISSEYPCVSLTAGESLCDTRSNTILQCGTGLYQGDGWVETTTKCYTEVICQPGETRCGTAYGGSFGTTEDIVIEKCNVDGTAWYADSTAYYGCKDGQSTVHTPCDSSTNCDIFNNVYDTYCKDGNIWGMEINYDCAYHIGTSGSRLHRCTPDLSNFLNQNTEKILEVCPVACIDQTEYNSQATCSIATTTTTLPGQCTPTGCGVDCQNNCLLQYQQGVCDLNGWVTCVNACQPCDVTTTTTIMQSCDQKCKEFGYDWGVCTHPNSPPPGAIHNIGTGSCTEDRVCFCGDSVSGCVDTDGGNLPNIFGTTYLVDPFGNTVPGTSRTDHCSSPNLLTEFFCIEGGGLTSATVSCTCQNGMCTTVTTTLPTTTTIYPTTTTIYPTTTTTTPPTYLCESVGYHTYCPQGEECDSIYVSSIGQVCYVVKTQPTWYYYAIGLMVILIVGGGIYYKKIYKKTVG